MLTAFFLIVILGATDKAAQAGFAPLAIGLALTLIHLVDIPITNASVNPARSTAPALFVGGWALAQLWAFWVAPLIGGPVGGYLHRWLEGITQIWPHTRRRLSDRSSPSRSDTSNAATLPRVAAVIANAVEPTR